MKLSSVVKLHPNLTQDLHCSMILAEAAMMNTIKPLGAS